MDRYKHFTSFKYKNIHCQLPFFDFSVLNKKNNLTHSNIPLTASWNIFKETHELDQIFNVDQSLTEISFDTKVS